MFRAWWGEVKDEHSMRVLRGHTGVNYWKRILHRSLFIIGAQWSDMSRRFEVRDAVMDLLSQASKEDWSTCGEDDLFGVPEGDKTPSSARFGVVALWHAIRSNNLWLLRLLLQWRGVHGHYVDPTSSHSYAVWAAARLAATHGCDALHLLIEWRGPKGEAVAVDTETWFAGPVAREPERLCARTVRWSALKRTWVAAVVA